jgi:hypothetical protein
VHWHAPDAIGTGRAAAPVVAFAAAAGATVAGALNVCLAKASADALTAAAGEAPGCGCGPPGAPASAAPLANGGGKSSYRDIGTVILVT